MEKEEKEVRKQTFDRIRARVPAGRDFRLDVAARAARPARPLVSRLPHAGRESASPEPGSTGESPGRYAFEYESLCDSSIPSLLFQT